MGTTRIKVIDLASGEEDKKSSKSRADKVQKIKAEKIAEQKEDTSVRKQEDVTDSKVEQKVDSNETAQDKQADEKKPAPKKHKAKPKAQKHHLSKKYQEKVSLIDKTKSYPTKEAIDLLYQTSYASFDPTVELHLNVNDKNIRGNVDLPNPIGSKKEKKFLVFSEKKTEDKNVIYATDKTLEEILKGTLKPGRDFDGVIAQPKFMPQIASVAKVLGPKGMMPNPKNGTVTEDVTKALVNSTSSGIDYKTDPTAPIIHTKLGKLSNKPEQIEENLKALVRSIGPSKIKKAVITSTMAPAIKIDITTIFVK